jgi:DNA-binding transcriptional regulator GbsR (MarR family)
MWKSIIIYMTISLIIIYILHQIWSYIINTYTEKKTNRVIDNQIEKYKEIIENLQQKEKVDSYIRREYTKDDSDETMSQDLETFLNTLSNT